MAEKHVTTGARWNHLHEQRRFRPVYPSEHVVRFLAAAAAVNRKGSCAVDIGCGAGRHLALLAEYGYKAFGVDQSQSALDHARLELGSDAFLRQSPMIALPFVDEFFDVAISYGVFYYATAFTAGTAIREMHRILKPGGRALVNVRTDRDWREPLTDETGVFRLDDHPEDGMPLHYLDETDIVDRYGMFSEVRYELTETTTDDMTRLNSDWLISVTK